MQDEGVVLRVENASRKAALDVAVGVRIRGVDVTCDRDARGLEHLVEGWSGGGRRALPSACPPPSPEPEGGAAPPNQKPINALTIPPCFWSVMEPRSAV